MQNNNQVERIGKIILRTPILPLKNIYVPVNYNILMQDQVFLAALFLASPVLYDEALRYKDGLINTEKEKRKIEESLTKYYLRMSSRCTPFGLFSACGAINQDEENSEGKEYITLPSVSKVKRFSRLDMNYLCALSLYISKLPEIITEFRFYSNTSLYTMGNKWRYVEYYYSSGNRIHQISSVDQDSLINKIIKEAQKGICFQDFKNVIIKFGIECSDEELLAYFKDLITSNILISELEPSVTGGDFLGEVITKLESVKSERIINITAILQKAQNLLNEADSEAPSSQLIDTYKKIIIVLKNLEVNIDETKLFQVDSFWKFEEKQVLDKKLYSDVDTAVNLLQQISKPYTNENLKSFAQKFMERYEEQELPIMQVLDTEAGIGYVQKKKTGSSSNQFNLSWGNNESVLYPKLQQCLIAKKTEIILDESDIEKLDKKNDRSSFSPSFTVLFRIVEKENTDGHNILIEHLSGSSVASLLGRFAENDPLIINHIKDVCAKEESLNPNVIFAEIVHLPQSRVGNILLHPPFRKSEIPYMALSSLSVDNQVFLEDLLISVKNDKIILRSKKLNKIIIPRLSNAHNHSVGSQPVYQFLCDLQYQNITPWLDFGWGDLARFNKFLPRISYKNIILQPCVWSFNQENIKKYLNNENPEKYQIFKDFCIKHNLPTIFLLSDVDNDLPVNTNDNQQIDVFFSTIKNKKAIILKEFLPSTNVLQDDEKNTYNNQFVASYIKKTKTYSGILPQKKVKIKSVTRSFNQNSEWIYFKIYCGVKTSNDILRNSISRCVNKLKKENLIDRWFFIRYADPDHHIRVRFHIPENVPFAKEQIISKLLNGIKSYEKSGLVWNVVIDTYKREIERYRQEIIEYAECLFSFDSDAILNYIKYNTDDNDSWWMYGLKSIEQTFNDFNLSLSERKAVVNSLSTSFNHEFQVGKSEKVRLDTMYRSRYKDIYNIVENNELTDDQIAINKILLKRTAASKGIIKEAFQQFSSEKIKIERMSDFLCSYIHMLMNRLCINNARQEEMIMYNMLMKYYTSKTGRLKYHQ